MNVTLTLWLMLSAVLTAGGALLVWRALREARGRRRREGAGGEGVAVPRAIEPTGHAPVTMAAVGARRAGAAGAAGAGVGAAAGTGAGAGTGTGTGTAEGKGKGKEKEKGPEGGGGPRRGRSIWAAAGENPLVEPAESVDDEVPDCPVPLVAIVSGARTDRGRRRKINEDNLLCVPERGLFVVADGMGGHAAGEVASQIAVETIARAFERGEFGRALHTFRPARADELVAAIEQANGAVWAQAEADRSKDGMGTTVVAARFVPNQPRVYVAFVGDSRCYRLRDGLMVQLTDDHTMSQLGFYGPQGEHLTRSVGIDDAVLVDLVSDVPVAGDVYLLCSDGLTKMVSDAMIRKVLRETADAEVAAGRLVDLANANGGKDNVTVIVVRVEKAALRQAQGRLLRQAQGRLLREAQGSGQSSKRPRRGRGRRAVTDESGALSNPGRMR